MKKSQIHKLQAAIQADPTLAGDAVRMSAVLEELGIHPDAVYQELEMEDRLVETHEDSETAPAMVQLHSHDYYEILYICEGDLHYLVGSELYRIRRGDVILIPPGISHQPMLTEARPSQYRRYVLWVSREFFRGVAPLFPDAPVNHPRLVRTAPTRQDTLEALFRIGIREAEQRNPGWQAALYGNTMELITLLYRSLSDKQTKNLPSEEPELLTRILAYMEKNLAGPISLETAAEHFFVSQSTVSNVFRREMGVSFHRCLIQRRLIAAKEKIEAGEVLENVALQVGFLDYSGFFRAFKKEYGISPRQYRKLKLQKLR